MTEINKTTSSLSLSQPALAVIEAYRNFKLTAESVPISVPYFNNKRKGMSTGLKALAGKGSPEDIKEEIEVRQLQEKLAIFPSTTLSHTLSSPELGPESGALTLKKYMWEHGIGIDCSGYTYAILEEENKNRGYGTIKSHLKFPYVKNFLMKIKARFHAIENTDVRTFAHPINSVSVSLKDVRPGDFITMIDSDKKPHNHIIVIYAVDYADASKMPTAIYYTHSIARPEDGQWNHGVRNGKIIITDVNVPIMQAQWLEEKVDVGMRSPEKSGENMHTPH